MTKKYLPSKSSLNNHYLPSYLIELEKDRFELQNIYNDFPVFNIFIYYD